MSGAAATAPPMARAQLSPPRSASRAGLRSPSCPPARRAVSARAVISPPAASGASFVGDDGVPFFALSDADRASELRANPEAIAAAAASPDAVLLPLSGTKVWIFPDDDDARSESERESHVRWRPAEAAVRDVPEDALDRGALSFLGFRARDGAPVFCADVTPGAMDAAVRSAVLRREKKGAGAGAGDVVVADAKSVAPEMRRADAGLLAAAAGLARWQRTVRFCSECGSRTVLVKAGHKARCADDAVSGCRGAFYPKLMPAVLTLCTCGDYALLGRNSKWPRGFYSTLAGFVDQSESLEQAVAREVLEESGVAIDERSTTYVASQPWPFPCQLMVGFEAKAAPRTVELTDKSARDITKTFSKTFSYPPTPNLDIHELRDARWFHRDWLREELRKNLGDPREPGNPREIPLGSVAVPGSHALARHLIERWVFGDGSGTAFASGDPKKSSSNAIEAVGLAGGAAAPRAPATNRPHTFVCVDFVGAGGGTRTALRIQPTGGGGAPTANDHARLLEDVAREASKREADRARNKEKRRNDVTGSSLRSRGGSSDDTSDAPVTRTRRVSDPKEKEKSESESKEGESFRVLGAGQLCFRGGEVSENSVHDDEREACLTLVLRNGGGGEAGGVAVAAAPLEVVTALLRRAYPMHDVLIPGRAGASGEYQY